MNNKDQAVQLRAYQLWEQEGRPEGRAHEHWMQAEYELGAGPSDLDENPGIGLSPGMTKGDPAELDGDNTMEGDVLNDTKPAGGVNATQRGRANK